MHRIRNMASVFDPTKKADIIYFKYRKPHFASVSNLKKKRQLEFRIERVDSETILIFLHSRDVTRMNCEYFESFYFNTKWLRSVGGGGWCCKLSLAFKHCDLKNKNKQTNKHGSKCFGTH